MKGELKLGTLPSIGAYFLPVATHRLHHAFPDLRLIIEEGGTHGLIEQLTNGKLDLVISSPIADKDLTVFPLFSESLWICAAADDELMLSREPVSLSALKGHQLISLNSSFRISNIVERIAELAGAEISSHYRGVSLDASRQMAVMGAGVAVLPSLYALNEAMRDSNFIIRRIDHPEARHPVSLVWRASSPLDQTFRQIGNLFIDMSFDLTGTF